MREATEIEPLREFSIFDNRNLNVASSVYHPVNYIACYLEQAAKKTTSARFGNRSAFILWEIQLNHGYTADVDMREYTDICNLRYVGFGGCDQFLY